MKKSVLTRRQSIIQSAIAALLSGVSVKVVLEQLEDFGIYVTAENRYQLISLLSHE